MPTLEQALETVSQLPAEQQEMLAEILRQRHNESWRRQVAAEARESIAAFHEGKLSAESSEQVIARLREGLNAPEEE
jgi:hypothetical protein